MTSEASETLYEERDGIAVVTLNRPEKRNALTEAMVQGVADAVGTAAASPEVAAIVLRGAHGTLTAGFDLSSVDEFSTGTEPDGWTTPYGANGPEPRPGAWDPVRDYQFMNHNVGRFMKLWECPKPVLAEMTGRAIDAATAHRIGLVSQVCPADEISSVVEAEARRMASIPANQLALNKLLINQAYENMGLRTTQMMATFFDGMSRHTEEALRWTEAIGDRGLREVIAERDGPWQDYGQAGASGD